MTVIKGNHYDSFTLPDNRPVESLLDLDDLGGGYVDREELIDVSSNEVTAYSAYTIEEIPSASASIQSPIQLPSAKSAKNSSRRGSRKWLRRFILLLIPIILIGYSIFIWQNPDSQLNIVPLISELLNQADDSSPEIIVVDSSTDISEESTEGAAIVAAPALTSFSLTQRGITYTANDNEQACDYAGIAGTVVSSESEFLEGYIIQISGDDFEDEIVSTSDLSENFRNFETQIGQEATETTYRVQLLSPEREPVSDEIELTTRADCDENIALLNFVADS